MELPLSGPVRSGSLSGRLCPRAQAHQYARLQAAKSSLRPSKLRVGSAVRTCKRTESARIVLGGAAAQRDRPTISTSVRNRQSLTFFSGVLGSISTLRAGASDRATTRLRLSALPVVPSGAGGLALSSCEAVGRADGGAPAAAVHRFMADGDGDGDGAWNGSAHEHARRRRLWMRRTDPRDRPALRSWPRRHAPAARAAAATRTCGML